MPHPVTGWQVITPDPDATANFYSRLFDWTTSKNNALGYRDLKSNGPGIDGGVWPAPAGTKPFVQLFVSVPDVKVHVARATALGARVIVPPSVLPDGGEMAVMHDPTGLPFALVREASGGDAER